MVKKWVNPTNKKKFLPVVVSIGAVLFLGSVAGAMGNAPSPAAQTTETMQSVQQQAKPVVTTKEITETSAVPFTNTTIEDNTVASGMTTITTAGIDGVRTKTWVVTYTDGEQTGQVLKNDEVTTPPVMQVTTVGTYIAPTTAFTTATTNSESTGAAAQCRDGSLSYSQHRSGTCSHHGGVATWY